MNNETLIIVLAVLIFFSAFFSATETAFSSVNKIRLKYLANNGDKKAEKTLSIAENFSSLLSTVLVGNNIVNIVSTSLATLLFVNMLGEDGVAVSSVVMTVLVLIFGEITPKTIASKNPEKFALTVTPFISFFAILLKPITVIFDFIGSFISSLVKTEDNEEFRSEEFITMVEEAEDDGVMDEHEADLITNAVEFNDLEVGDVFTPRVDVVACSLDEPLDEIEKKFRESGYSRIPCYKDTIDNIVGVLHEKDFYYIYRSNSKASIDKILQKVIYTSEHVKISALLRQLQSNKIHMAVVIDEYGGTSGIITMEDVLEELVGEIYDEHDEIIEYFKKVNDNEFIVNCDADIEDMFEFFDLKPDDEYDFNTVSGWVISNMDKIPEVGESFDYNDMHVTITSADQKTVNEIKIEFNNNDENRSNE